MTDYPIREMAETCGIDQTIREVCPKCGGGQSGERSLAVSRYSTGYAWFCHRASCGFRGAEWDLGISHGRVAAKKPASFNPLEAYPRRIVFAKEVPELYDALGYSEVTHFEIYGRENPALDQTDVCFWCRGVWGDLVAYHVRRKLLSGAKFCKTYAAGAGTESPYAYYPSEVAPEGEIENVWLVEDPISACRLSRFGRGKDVGVSILGTNVQSSVVKTIRDRFGNHLRFLVALDRDASIKALHASSRIAQEVGVSIYPVPLRDDIKNLSTQDLKTLLSAHAS